MKKIVSVILLIHCIFFAGKSQVSFHVFPVGVNGEAFADTLLNSRAILQKAGIKQFSSYQTFDGISQTFITRTVHLDEQGRIQHVSVCFDKSMQHDLSLCVFDTIVYDEVGRVSNLIESDTRSGHYSRAIYKYVDSLHVVIEQDSLLSYLEYNNKGQLLSYRKTLKGKDLEHTRYFYNQDGLIDRIQNSHRENYVYKRRKKGKTRVVSMKNREFSYTWVYNANGQCIRQNIVSNSLSNYGRNTEIMNNTNSVARYFYNEDGTISKVITQTNNMPDYITQYSYIKY